MSEEKTKCYISENSDSVTSVVESTSSSNQETEKTIQEKEKTCGKIIGATPELLDRLDKHAKLVEWSISVLRNVQAERQRKKAAGTEYWKAERRRIRALWAHPQVPWHPRTTIRCRTTQRDVDEESTDNSPKPNNAKGDAEGKESSKEKDVQPSIGLKLVSKKNN